MSTFLTIAEIGTLAQNAGFTGNDLITAVAIALAESGGNPNDLGDTNIGSGTGSFGLWQINADSHPEYGPDFTQLYDPQTNANAAYAIYSAAGDSFTPWTTFKTGAFNQFMTSAAAAVATLITQNPGTSGLVIAVLIGLYFLLRRA